MTDEWDHAPVPDAVPVLPVADLTRSMAWYARLGFTERALYPGYAILGFQGTELHLAAMEGITGTMSLSGVYLRVTDAAAVHASWLAVGARQVAPLTDTAYGIREFATEDLDGNAWRVGSPIPGGLLDQATEAGVAHEPGTDEAAVEAASSPADGEPTAAVAAVAATDGDADDGRWFALVAGGGTCAQCGMVVADTPARALGATVREEVHAFGLLVTLADDVALRRRRGPESWSALEYAVHVRDVLRVFAERVVLALRLDDPELGWWDHEAAIADGLANESDVSAVVDDLARNSAHLSEALRAVEEDDWSRGATRRETERFTIDTLGRFALHEVVHHRWDAQQALGAAGAN